MSTPTFRRLSLDQFSQLLEKFPFTRNVNAVHMHHTWRPARADFKGHETIVSMWRFHTQEMGWRDIAQHITIDPQGFVWLGRNWNLPPASAAGHNGNERFGPFMFEMIGNFDTGHDPFDGAQKETALQVIARVQARFSLATDTLMFHNALSPKSCPGSSLDYAGILAAVEQRKEAQRTPEEGRPGIARAIFPDEQNLLIADAIEALSQTPAGNSEPGDAELSHHEQQDQGGTPSGRSAARDSGLGAAALAALRPHLVNLSMGRFSGEGEAATSPADVDAIFDQHLKEALDKAKNAGHKLRLLFYAHGGLVSESSGLQIAAKHIDWWKKNDIYPIYFIWETGLFETLGNLLKRAQQGATRAMGRDLFDFTSDPLIEITARALRGPSIWGSMKSSAEHAVDPPTTGNPEGGGAFYVASQLKKFCDRNAQDIELHAVGHSAGAIFLCHFLPVAHELKVPTFTTAHFLAPAVRVDTFKERLAPVIGDDQAIRKLTVFTMKKDYERDDDCAHVYRKSLLYLIYYALENRRATPILGLEESLRGDGDLKRLFGLDGNPSKKGQVVWSVTQSDTGMSASQSQTHGGFDDDAPTMNSVARLVLNREDADKIVDYAMARGLAASSREWTDEIDWPEELNVTAPPTPASPVAPAFHGSATSSATAYRPVSASMPAPLPGTGRRRALCVGINRYPDPRHQLAGCVADARMWADALSRLGFTASLLLDGQATREAIDRELLALVNSSAPGDVIVFQYAGHGTHVPDLNGDEEDGQDEAICPVDFAAGALYIDDDIAAAFTRIPDGVNLTCFMDCCHSGTNSRFAVGAPPTQGARSGKDERKRYVEATPDIIEAHRRFREKSGGGQRAISSGGISLMRDVKFSACLDAEVAWESDGHGEFTLRATRILGSGIEGFTNREFAQRVIADFGISARQHPMLDCVQDANTRYLLQPARPSAAGGAGSFSGPAMAGSVDNAMLVQTLASIQQLLAALAAK
ncbi:MAG: caspase family protein [Polaromonas sp.]